MVSIHRHLLSIGNAPGPVLSPEEMGIKKTQTVHSGSLEDKERARHWASEYKNINSSAILEAGVCRSLRWEGDREQDVMRFWGKGT